MKAVVGLVAAVASSVAMADPKVMVQPARARPGDAVLVTVTGTSDDAPTGDAGGTPLQFFRARAGYQAVFAIPLDGTDTSIAVAVDRAGAPARVAVRSTTWPEVALAVDDGHANPPADVRARITEDDRALLAALAKADGRPLAGAFVRPPGRVTATFGEWRTFNDSLRTRHLGIDVAAKHGAPVRATNGGTVTLVRDTFVGGNVVVIAHGAGIATAYFHLSATNVAEGDAVETGDVIGRAGNTGRATGPHLHVSVRVPGGFVDPARFFALRIAPRP